MRESLSSKIFRAIVAKLSKTFLEDASERVIHVVKAIRHEDQFLTEVRPQLPAIGVKFLSLSREKSAGFDLQKTGFEILLAMSASFPNEPFLTADLVEMVLESLFEERGVLRDPENAGICLTEALEFFDTVSADSRLETRGDFLVTPMVVEFASQWQLPRMEIL